MTYWGAGDDWRIFVTSRYFLYALDARTGRLVGSFGDGGRVDLRRAFERDGVTSYDVRTGAMRWTFHTIPRPGEFGYDTWPKDAWKHTGGANHWAGMSIDRERGIVFVPTGSAAFDFHGADLLIESHSVSIAARSEMSARQSLDQDRGWSVLTSPQPMDSIQEHEPVRSESDPG